MSLLAEAKEQGLSEEEYNRIVETLGREPNSVELSIFAVMWSEHCCYKSSKVHLKKLPTRGPRVVQGPGENAGVIEFDGDQLVAFKIESHNHPSYIEPYQGAATGVGGILRDIFAMGARPIAVLDALHFGEPTHEKTPHLLHGVVSGIGGYGNCVGIPNIGGEVHFDRAYNGNILVNAMAIGIAKKGEMQKGGATGEGNLVIYMGSKTGRDGIHGATMASEEFGEGNEERRPTVQVGDPFTEKLLIEACIDLARENLLVGLQDMGAAGITCSTFEMAERGKTGMQVDLDKVPLRAEGMKPFEIFLSESQERMLLIVEPSKADRVKEIAEKWELDSAVIGRVIPESEIRATWKGEEVVRLPIDPVTGQAPEYNRVVAQPKVCEAVGSIDALNTQDLKILLTSALETAEFASRRPVYVQYDHTVGTNTVYGPGYEAGVLRIKGSRKLLAATVDSNHHYCRAHPYLGTCHVLFEAARNLVSVGATPMALTNCLNFGNPEDPQVMGQFEATIRAMIEVCDLLKTPVTGGNVSFYNQTGGQNIDPTPTIGLIGDIPKGREPVSNRFSESGLSIFVLGAQPDEVIYQSFLARQFLGETDLACPPMDVEAEKRLLDLTLSFHEEGILRTCKDVSEGGLFQALVESCDSDENWNRMGARLDLPNDYDPISLLLGETGGRFLVSVEPTDDSRIIEVCQEKGVPLLRLGTTAEDGLSVPVAGRFTFEGMDHLRRSFWKGLS